MRITVYTKPSCVQCTYTKKELDRIGLAYTAIDVTEDDAARNLLQDNGICTLPYVVATGQEPWSGFKPERIRALLESPAPVGP